MAGTSAEPYSGVDIEVGRSKVLEQPMPKKFRIVGKFRDPDSHEAIPEHEVNKSLLKIDAELQEVWYSNIIVYDLQAKKNGLFCSHDVGPREFRNAVDVLRMSYDQVQQRRERMINGPNVLGARIANSADIYFCFYKRVEILPVNATQYAMMSDIEAPICDRLGIPLVLHRSLLSLTGGDGRLNPYEVVGIAPLLHYLDPFIPLDDNRHGIGAIAVRKDGKPICHAHVEAFIAHGERIIACQSANGYGQHVNLDMCSKEDFMAWYPVWYQTWKALEMVKGNTELDVPSP
jgi:hypothetical protein